MARGSLPGERRGGRQRGTPNHATAAKAAEVAASGMTPLDYLVSVYRDETATRPERLEAAAKANSVSLAELMQKSVASATSTLRRLRALESRGVVESLNNGRWRIAERRRAKAQLPPVP